jgi:Ser/Thr protein kinase RdoA (MazF antagonist)
MADPAPPCDAWFGHQPTRLGSIPSSGFSGAQVFLVERVGLQERFVLKSFAPSASRQHAEWVHRLMRHLRAEGIGQVPAVHDCLQRDRGTIARDAHGGLWELVEFIPGTPRERPTVGQATAAAEVLARIHVVAAELPGERRHPAPSPGVLRRRDQARKLLERPWRERYGALARDDQNPVVGRLGEAVAVFDRAGGTRVVEKVASVEPRPMTLQPVLRDVWCEHVLFADGADDERVNGLVDFHAAGIDTPATDLARLFGSWTAGGDSPLADLLDAWSGPLAAYGRVRPLTDMERSLVPFLDATAVIFGLDNWFRWTLEERREFREAGRVLGRIDRLLAVLERAIGKAGDAVGRLN